MTRIREMMRNWLPPVLLSVVRRRRKSGIQFEGRFSSWEEAESLTDGYAHEEIVRKVLGAMLKVKAGEVAFERDSVLFDEIVYSWPVTAGLMLGAVRQHGKLLVLDYGGALGSHYFQNRKFLEVLDGVSWNVVEQPHYVEAGKRHIEDGSLRFYQDLDDCIEETRPNVILVSSVLQYLPTPMDTLAALAAAEAEVVILDRTPYLKGDGAPTVTIQRVPESIYRASYPCWFFDERQVVGVLERAGYSLLETFPALDKLDEAAVWKGHLFIKAT